jgi:hypothetical protein
VNTEAFHLGSKARLAAIFADDVVIDRIWIEGAVEFSGKLRGTRAIWGGRAQVRAVLSCAQVLYMCTLVATRRNPLLRAFYARLIVAGVSSQIKCERELSIREWCKFIMIRMHLRANRPETIACRLLFDLFQEIQFAGERAADMWPGSPATIIASRNAIVVSHQIAEHFRATQLGVAR